MKRLITITSICGALILPAMAADGDAKGKGKGRPEGRDGKRPSPEAIFGRLDADNSGGISLEEFKAGPMAKKAKDPSMVDARFKKIDGDGDGVVSQKELTASFKARAGKGGKPGGKKGERPKKPESKTS